MSKRGTQTRQLLLGAAAVIVGYLVLREVAYTTRVGEVILSPGAHSGSMPVYVMLLCVAFRMLSTVVVPGLLAARLWWVWSRPEC